MAQPKTASEKTWRDVFYTTSVALAKGEKAPADKYSGPILDLGFGFKKHWTTKGTQTWRTSGDDNDDNANTTTYYITAHTLLQLEAFSPNLYNLNS